MSADITGDIFDELFGESDGGGNGEKKDYNDYDLLNTYVKQNDIIDMHQKKNTAFIKLIRYFQYCF